VRARSQPMRHSQPLDLGLPLHAMTGRAKGAVHDRAQTTRTEDESRSVERDRDAVREVRRVGRVLVPIPGLEVPGLTGLNHNGPRGCRGLGQIQLQGELASGPGVDEALAVAADGAAQTQVALTTAGVWNKALGLTIEMCRW